MVYSAAYGLRFSPVEQLKLNKKYALPAAVAGLTLFWLTLLVIDIQTTLQPSSAPGSSISAGHNQATASTTSQTTAHRNTNATSSSPGDAKQPTTPAWNKACACYFSGISGPTGTTTVNPGSSSQPTLSVGSLSITPSTTGGMGAVAGNTTGTPIAPSTPITSEASGSQPSTAPDTGLLPLDINVSTPVTGVYIDNSQRTEVSAGATLPL